jgi:hypothetical protein
MFYNINPEILRYSNEYQMISNLLLERKKKTMEILGLFNSKQNVLIMGLVIKN